jgi:hypothetical protein
VFERPDEDFEEGGCEEPQEDVSGMKTRIGMRSGKKTAKMV